MGTAPQQRKGGSQVPSSREGTREGPQQQAAGAKAGQQGDVWTRAALQHTAAAVQHLQALPQVQLLVWHRPSSESLCLGPAMWSILLLALHCSCSSVMLHFFYGLKQRGVPVHSLPAACKLHNQLFQVPANAAVLCI